MPEQRRAVGRLIDVAVEIALIEVGDPRGGVDADWSSQIVDCPNKHWLAFAAVEKNPVRGTRLVTCLI